MKNHSCWRLKSSIPTYRHHKSFKYYFLLLCCVYVGNSQLLGRLQAIKEDEVLANDIKAIKATRYSMADAIGYRIMRLQSFLEKVESQLKIQFGMAHMAAISLCLLSYEANSKHSRMKVIVALSGFCRLTLTCLMIH